jgi:hypothetical protein
MRGVRIVIADRLPEVVQRVRQIPRQTCRAGRVVAGKILLLVTEGRRRRIGREGVSKLLEVVEAFAKFEIPFPLGTEEDGIEEGLDVL